jgi:hypothetical protein
MNQTIRRGLGGATLGVSLLFAGAAEANGLEFPSNGTEQMGRGSAWLARATDPLAVFYNPAALARNKTAASLTVNLTFENRCFSRVGPDGNTVQLQGRQETGKSCNDASGTPFPNPQLALNWRVNDKLGIGFAVMGPSAYGAVDFGGTSKENRSLLKSTLGQKADGPAGTRYMLSGMSNLLIWPQIAVGYEVAPNLRLGASFIWGVAIMDFTSFAMGTSSEQTLTSTGLVETAAQDVRAHIKAKDWFVPGFVASALYSATPTVDIAAWYHYSDSIKATGETQLDAFVFNNQLKAADDTVTTNTAKGKTVVSAAQPMEARIGARFHLPRPGVEPGKSADPLHDDLFDVELDGEWSHDSQFSGIDVEFQGPPQSVNVAGLGSVGPLPAKTSIPHNWKDAFGLRLGGDYNLLPDRLALRAGAWFQTSSIDPKYVHVDFFPTQRVGLSGGATVRFSPVDVQVGYQHVFMKDVDNKGDGRILGLTGSGNNLSTYAVNGGKLTGSANIFSIGAVARF